MKKEITNNEMASMYLHMSVCVCVRAFVRACVRVCACVRACVGVCLFEIYLFRVTRSSVINSCFSTRPWLNNTTTIHAWTTCGNSQCSYMMLQINFESIQ